MTIRRWINTVAILCAAAAIATPALAQNTVYQQRAGDTIRYRDLTRMDGVSHEAAGDAALTLTREASLSITFTGAESAQAWYDALNVESSSPLGGQKANSDSLLRAPFMLRIEPDGRTQTLRTPVFPRSMRLIAELPPSFDDFFPRLPRTGGPLKLGTTWVDTVTQTRSDSAGRRLSIRRITRSLASRDSMVGGKRLLVVSMRTEVRIESVMPMQAQPYVAHLALTGTENGIALFAIAEGRMISRERDGNLKGAVTYKGGDAPWVVNQSYKYHRSIVAMNESPVGMKVLP